MNPSDSRSRIRRLGPAARPVVSATALTALLSGATLVGSLAPAGAELALQLHASGSSEFVARSNILLHVPAGGTPSPFLPAGPFTAEWNGSLQIDLRGEYQFQATHAGAFSLEINGTPVVQTSHQPGTTDWSAHVRLRKGTNVVRAVLSRTNASEAAIRLSWRGRGLPPSPLPVEALQPPAEPTGMATNTAFHASLRRGRDAFLLRHCGKCHDPEVPTPVPELSADAPDFAGIGSRREKAWLARWIRSPRTLRPDAIMPELLHGSDSDSAARSIAAWLATLTDSPTQPAPATLAGNPAAGRALFEALLCQSCHGLPTDPPATDRISLAQVRDKFGDGSALVEFLLKPERHHSWSRMPNFHLNAGEASHLAAWLRSQGSAADPKTVGVSGPIPDTADEIRRGRELAEQYRCFRCHKDPLSESTAKPEVTAKPLRALNAHAERRPNCLEPEGRDNLGPKPQPPLYSLTPAERTDLRNFVANERGSLGRDEPADFARRWTRQLRCSSCHGTAEGVPRLDYLGEKLRPEWFARFVEGNVSYKPRPWLASRMPSFPAFGTRLAAGFAASCGYGAKSPVEPAVDPEAAAVGRKLVSASTGFACVSCHAIGPFGATAVFEAPGVNLVHAGERLRPEFFARWVRNPQAFEPTTKMPLYFDEEGNSALSDYFGGDGPKTIRALWDYVRQGSGLTPPEP